jgi:diguanylate cyclase
MGDRLIRLVATLIQVECRYSHFPCRIGGDEFVILMPGTTHGEAKQMMARIRDAARSERLESIVVSIAMGIATSTSNELSVVDILKIAENEMYKNKLKHGKAMRSSTIETILTNVNQKFEREQTHNERVAKFCEQMGQVLSQREGDIEEYRLCGVLHDIGKIVIPVDLINKPEMLSELEYEAVKRHTEIGYQIVRSVDEYASIASSVLYHHERWDGMGYPQGLRGAEIPLKSRVVAVADAFEAMTSERKYKRKMSQEEAVEELLRNAGTQFDPEVVDIFVHQILGQE